MTVLSKTFTDEDKAREFLEANRWPDGPVCPFCGQQETVKALPAQGSMGKGWFSCRDCRQKFTVRVGTLYERSHVPLHKWLYATHLLCSSKKGISAHQLHRMLGVTYKTAWFMAHRIREGMAPKTPPALGGQGATVEADETYIGRKAGAANPGAGHGHKIAVMGLVERGGKGRMVHIGKATKKTVQTVLHTNVDRKSTLYTDEAKWYERDTGMKHATVTHSLGQYVRYAKGVSIHTNTVEGMFSIFKRGMIGTYQHCGEQHLHRYLAEFDFRYSNRAKLGVNDEARAEIALKGIEGKRLTYRRTVQA
ncbi:MAG: transposase [Gammaproteobacteria bacterium RIFCSPHIGHO2_12_FULL_63_22]|nr:MAG: transposase [Gammaproteobacteria bacterium RIFCSPHIGHO2_12_FULL_63_22]